MKEVLNMVYEIETDIYNIYAKFLVEADENGNFSLQEYISYDRSYFIEYNANKINNALSSNLTLNERNFLMNELYLEIKNKSLIDKLSFLVAYDRRNVGNIGYVNELKNKKEQNINDDYTDKILIFPTYRRRISHNKSYNTSFSCLFSNICFIYKNVSKYRFRNIYIENILKENESLFRFGFIPYSSKYNVELDKKRCNGKMKIISWNNIGNENDDVHLVAEIKYLSESGVHFITCPEMLPSYIMSTVVDDVSIENIIDNSNIIIYGPASYKESEGKRYNEANLYNKQLINGHITIRKCYRYYEKYDGSDSAIGYEDIEESDILNVLHVENFGIILLLICSDYFINHLDDIIKMLNVDCIVIASATKSYNQFNCSNLECINENRVLLQCNLCSFCFDENESMKISPINVMGKPYYNDDVMSVIKKYRCVNFRNECKICNKHFIVNVSIDNNKMIIKEDGDLL